MFLEGIETGESSIIKFFSQRKFQYEFDVGLMSCSDPVECLLQTNQCRGCTQCFAVNGPLQQEQSLSHPCEFYQHCYRHSTQVIMENWQIPLLPDQPLMITLIPQLLCRSLFH